MKQRFEQTPGTRWTLIGIGVIGAFLPLPTVTSGDASTAVATAACLPVAIWSIWMILRMSRCGIRDAGDELLVRNPARTIAIAWPSVEGFELGRVGIMPKVGVRRTDGTAVGVFGLPVAAHGPDPSTRRLLDRYEDKLKDLRPACPRG